MLLWAAEVGCDGNEPNVFEQRDGDECSQPFRGGGA